MDLARWVLMRRARTTVALSLVFSALTTLTTLTTRVSAAQLATPPRVTIPGTSYTVSATGASGPLGGGFNSSGTTSLQNYIGHVVFAAGRGRMDIVEGGVETLFGKGDYLLFDSTDVVVVRPGSRTYVAIPRDIASRGMDRLGSMGVRIAVTDEKATLDSISVGDTVAGISTRHFRMTVAFNIAMDAGFIQQRLGTESVIDYWVSSSPVIPPNPLLRANGFAVGPMTGGMFKSLSAKVDSVAARMGTMAALKTKSVTRLITGPGAQTETQQIYEVSEIASRDVDEQLLILPSGFTAVGLPGETVRVSAPDSISAKWRMPPASQSRPR
jgi:hypothetical protein